MQTTTNENTAASDVTTPMPPKRISKNGFKIRLDERQQPRTKRPDSNRSKRLFKSAIPSKEESKASDTGGSPGIIPACDPASPVEVPKESIPDRHVKEESEPVLSDGPKGKEEPEMVETSERRFQWCWYRSNETAKMLGDDLQIDLDLKKLRFIGIASALTTLFWIWCFSYRSTTVTNEVFRAVFFILSYLFPWMWCFPDHFMTRRFTVRSREEILPRHATGDMRNDLMRQAKLLHASNEVVVEYGEQLVFFAPLMRIIYTIALLLGKAATVGTADLLTIDLGRSFCPPKGFVDHPSRLLAVLIDFCSTRNKWRRLIVSRSAMAQLATPYNLSFDSDEAVVFKRLCYDASKLSAVNVDKDDFACPNGKAVLQDSALILYGYYKSLRQQRSWMDFPSTPV
jgi:hypothetical protein